jgi:hypothetical protein
MTKMVQRFTIQKSCHKKFQIVIQFIRRPPPHSKSDFQAKRERSHPRIPNATFKRSEKEANPRIPNATFKRSEKEANPAIVEKRGAGCARAKRRQRRVLVRSMCWRRSAKARRSQHDREAVSPCDSKRTFKIKKSKPTNHSTEKSGRGAGT